MTTTGAAVSNATAGMLGRAVHRHSLMSWDGVLERCFTLAFRDLVYPMIWEDPRVDIAALDIRPSTRMVTIASGGCNVLDYLTESPSEIVAVDLNRAHIALNRLKLVALNRLDHHQQFFDLFGNGGVTSNEATYRTLLAPHLDRETRRYWESRDLFGRQRLTGFTRGFYQQGLLGRFISAGHMAALLYGKSPCRMMAARSQEEQREIFERDLAPLFDRRLVRWLLSHRASLYGLGIPPAQYAALIGDASHMADVVRERLRKLACDFDLEDNYFAWAAFNRAFSKDGLGPHPRYLDQDLFFKIKALAPRISIRHTSFTQYLETQADASVDRFVLLDAQDWMNDHDLRQLWQHISRTARPGARVIFRTAGECSILPGRVPGAILDRWSYQEARSRELGRQDRSAIYGGFHLYTLKDVA